MQQAPYLNARVDCDLLLSITKNELLGRTCRQSCAFYLKCQADVSMRDM